MINGANWGKYNCENLVVGLRGSVKPPQITTMHLRTVHILAKRTKTQSALRKTGQYLKIIVGVNCLQHANHLILSE